MLTKCTQKYLLMTIRTCSRLQSTGLRREKNEFKNFSIKFMKMVTAPDGNMTGDEKTGEPTLDDHANLNPTLQSGSGELYEIVGTFLRA